MLFVGLKKTDIYLTGPGNWQSGHQRIRKRRESKKFRESVSSDELIYLSFQIQFDCMIHFQKFPCNVYIVCGNSNLIILQLLHSGFH